jgi:hypothetical protein
MVLYLAQFSKTEADGERPAKAQSPSQAHGNAKRCEVFHFRHPNEDFVTASSAEVWGAELDQDLNRVCALASRY